jgi:hypothetical protein
MLQSLSDAIFKADLNELPNPVRRNIQVVYTEQLLGIWKSKFGFDGVTKSHILAEIKRIESRMKTTPPKTVIDMYALTAHRNHILQLIDMALEE